MLHVYNCGGRIYAAEYTPHFTVVLSISVSQYIQDLKQAPHHNHHHQSLAREGEEWSTGGERERERERERGEWTYHAVH
jgi:hypothetical protein